MSDPTDLVALSAESDLSANLLTRPIKTSSTMVVGGYAGLEAATGTLKFFTHATGVYPAGHCVTHSEVGKQASQVVTGDGTKTCTVQGGQRLKSVTVAGGAGSAADVGKLVYATDGQTLTMTEPATYKYPIGWAAAWIGGTTYDVQELPLSLMIAYAKLQETFADHEGRIAALEGA